MIGVCEKSTTPKRCSKTDFVVNFFKDSPWLDIPEDRKGEILIEPLYPPGKLLGGAPAQETKVSKLAALTAARKNKGYNKNFDEPSRSVNTSVALLNRLSGNLNTARTNEDIKIQGHKLPVSAATTSSEDTTLSEQNQLTKERKQQYAGPIEETNLTLETINGGLKKPLDAPIASPSTFARAMFGSGDSQRLPCIPSQLLYFCAPRAPDTDFDAFIGPSPEDIVLEAQKPKGLFLID